MACGENSTYSPLKLSPAHSLTTQCLGRIINQNTLLKDMRVPLVEEPDAEGGDRFSWRLGEDDYEVHRGGDGVDAFDLEVKRRSN